MLMSPGLKSAGCHQGIRGVFEHLEIFGHRFRGTSCGFEFTSLGVSEKLQIRFAPFGIDVSFCFISVYFILFPMSEQSLAFSNIVGSLADPDGQVGPAGCAVSTTKMQQHLPCRMMNNAERVI